MTDLQRAAQAVLDALLEYEHQLEAENHGPVAWTVFDPQIGAVATLRSFYPPDHQLPDPGQTLYREFWGSLPPDEAWKTSSPLRPEHAHNILHHLDRFKAWLVEKYELAPPHLRPSTQLSQLEDDFEDATGPIPPERRTCPLALSEAALLMGYPGDKKQAAKQLKRAMEQGAIRYKQLTRQSFVFDREDFPAEARSRLLPIRRK